MVFSVSKTCIYKSFDMFTWCSSLRVNQVSSLAMCDTFKLDKTNFKKTTQLKIGLLKNVTVIY